ncbi:MAG: ABC transporter ATP-binding protein [Actinomycetaceae bacterium]|nr:ABC transporter ATP-binding protein [Actinomycetaceae bacterium]
MTHIIDLNIKEKIYTKKRTTLHLLRDFTLQIQQGETIAILGESGSGKSTLLNILGLLDTQYSGRYSLYNTDVKTLSVNTRAQWRNEKIGFVLQESTLIHSMSIKDNITLPLLYSQKKYPSQQWYEEIVETLDITHILDKKPLECSGGEKSRVSFARGIIMDPPLILSDEPTASLDTKNRNKLMSLLFDRNKNKGTTLVTVTHDENTADLHGRKIHIYR